MDYIAYLHKDRDSDFGVSFPDFPGCVTAGRTLARSAYMVQSALHRYPGPGRAGRVKHAVESKARRGTR